MDFSLASGDAFHHDAIGMPRAIGE